MIAEGEAVVLRQEDGAAYEVEIAHRTDPFGVQTCVGLLTHSAAQSCCERLYV